MVVEVPCTHMNQVQSFLVEEEEEEGNGHDSRDHHIAADREDSTLLDEVVLERIPGHESGVALRVQFSSQLSHRPT